MGADARVPEDAAPAPARADARRVALQIAGLVAFGLSLGAQAQRAMGGTFPYSALVAWAVWLAWFIALFARLNAVRRARRFAPGIASGWLVYGVALSYLVIDRTPRFVPTWWFAATAAAVAWVGWSDRWWASGRREPDRGRRAG